MKSIIFLTLMLLFAVGLSAQTNVPAGAVEGTWTAAGSPYLVLGNISIASDRSLTIEAGVDVIFQGTFKLDVLGYITTSGSPELPITITAQDTLNGWSSIRFSNNGSGGIPPSSFTHTNFLYGRAIWGSGGQDPLNYGGAIWADNAGTLTFDHCMFNRCKSMQDGSAVYAKNGTDIVMNHCMVKNSESGFFGGIFVKNGAANLTNCLFDSNTAVTFGAGFYFYECTQANVTSCVVSNNTAGAVAGIYCFDSPLQIKNSLFANNVTTLGTGGGMGVIYGTVNIVNCTFYGNNGAQGGSAAWFNQLDAPATITNCIFWENQAPVILTNSSTYTLSYCSMQAQEGDATNIFGDPVFVAPNTGDYMLQATSPCIDAGTPDASNLGLPAEDLAGQPRIVDGVGEGQPRIDIGCYEWQVPILDGVISGLVRTAQNEPIADATITVNDLTATSDAAGFYTIELHAGTYDVSCSKPGYYPVTEYGVVVESDNTTTLHFYLDAVGNADEHLVPGPILRQNHPNPFRGITSVSYYLDRDSRVLLSIHNLKGQLVKTLHDGIARAGEHQLDWDGLDQNGSPAARGLYFLRLRSGDGTYTRKLIKL